MKEKMIKPWAWTVFSVNAKIFGFAGILRAFLDRKMKGASYKITPAIIRAPLLYGLIKDLLVFFFFVLPEHPCCNASEQ